MPDWIDPVDMPSSAVASLTSNLNKTFGRRFEIVSVKEIASGTVL